MATKTWKSASTGTWNTAADWKNGVPGSTDTANISVTGASYTVTIDGTGDAASVLNITSADAAINFGIASPAALTITKALTLADGSFTIGENAGDSLSVGTKLTIAGGDFSQIGGTVTADAGLATATGTALSAGSLSISGGTFTDYSALTVSGGSLDVSGGSLFASTLGISAGSFDQTGGSVAVSKVAITGGASIAVGTGSTLTDAGALSIAGAAFDVGGKVKVTGPGQIAASGSLLVDGGTFTLTKALSTNAGLVDVEGGGVATFGTNVTGNFDISSAGTVIVGGNVVGSAASFTLSGGSVNLELGGKLGSGTFSFSGANESIYLNDPGKSVTNAFSGFNIGDTLGISGVVIASVSYADTTLTVNTSGGKYTYSDFNLAAPANFVYGTTTFNDNTYGYVELVVCFAAGTLIRTDHGEVAVEDIAAGDRVVTLEDGHEVLRAVTWVGCRRLDIASHKRPELVAPVRVRAGAFGEGLPKRDLLVSPDHCLFVDGKLVPAKLLVNDMTIINDRAISTVTYHHIELEEHAVLLAEGLPAESYLDTGNRAFFADPGLATVLHPAFPMDAGHRGWEGACAKLASEPADVEPLWHRLAARAEALGHVRPALPTTTEPDLHVLADGRAIRPVAVTAGRHVFVLPAGAESVRLASRFAIPADTAPHADDRRRLGVAVSRITLRSEAGHVQIPADHPALSRGWHAAERNGAAQWRWTDGDAVLPTEPTECAVMLEVQVSATATYILREAAQVQRLAA